MTGRMISKHQFDTPPTVDEAIEALQDLRAMTGGEAVLRVSGVIEFDMNGTRVASFAAERQP